MYKKRDNIDDIIAALNPWNSSPSTSSRAIVTAISLLNAVKDNHKEIGKKLLDKVVDTSQDSQDESRWYDYLTKIPVIGDIFAPFTTFAHAVSGHRFGAKTSTAWGIKLATKAFNLPDWTTSWLTDKIDRTNHTEKVEDRHQEVSPEDTPMVH